MKNYEKLKIELLILSKDDVITASGGPFVDNDGDFNKNFEDIWGGNNFES